MKNFDDIFKIINVVQASKVRELRSEEKELLNNWLKSDSENEKSFVNK